MIKSSKVMVCELEGFDDWKPEQFSITYWGSNGALSDTFEATEKLGAGGAGNRGCWAWEPTGV